MSYHSDAIVEVTDLAEILTFGAKGGCFVDFGAQLDITWLILFSFLGMY